MVKEKVVKSPVSGFLVPIGIILGGALLILGITKMLSAGNDYKDLVQDLHSESFGNHWVAAYELSKYISSDQIPAEDIPWLVAQLSELYEIRINDPRTRNFIVLALGSIGDQKANEIFNKSLDLIDSKNEEELRVLFNAVVAIGNLKNFEGIDFNKFSKILASNDSGLVQVSLLALAKAKFLDLNDQIIALEKSNLFNVRYHAHFAALSLGKIESLKEISKLFSTDFSELDPAQLQAYKLNALESMRLYSKPNKSIVTLIEKIARSENDLIVQTRAKQFLIELKKQ